MDKYKQVFCISILLITALSCLSALAIEPPVIRLALVVGNDAYELSPLNNAVNDASDMGDILEEIGFEVFLYENVSRQSLHQAVKQFYTELAAYNGQKIMAIFYYAGHAVQINHRNYLVPIDIDGTGNQLIQSLFDINLLFETIPQRVDISNIIILDACRDNPFENHDMFSGDGLAPLRAPASTLIAYATEPGNVAQDGAGRNGMYTKHLLRQIKEETPVEEVFRKVRKAVARATRNRQIPWEHSSLVEEVFFNAPVNRAVPELMSF